MEVHEEITKSEFRKDIFKRKIYILDFFIKEDVITGSLLSPNASCYS